MPGNTFPDFIATERIMLLRWSDSYAGHYADMCADPEVMSFIAAGNPYTHEQAIRSQQKISRHWQTYGYGMYAVFEQAQHQFIGMCGLATADYLANFPAVPEIGWRFMKKFWHQGYAREAASEIIYQAQQSCLIPDLYAVIQPENIASKKLASRLKMLKIALDTDHEVQKEVEIWHLRLQEGKD